MIHPTSIQEKQATIREIIEREMCFGPMNGAIDRLEAALLKHIRHSFLLKRIQADREGWNDTWALKSLEADLLHSRAVNMVTKRIGIG